MTIRLTDEQISAIEKRLAFENLMIDGTVGPIYVSDLFAEVRALKAELAEAKNIRYVAAITEHKVCKQKP